MRAEASVIGTGIMGRGIALLFALNNFKVVIYDSSPESLNKAKDLIAKDLSLMIDEQLVPAGKKQAALDNIVTVDKLSSAVVNSDFIVEAVPERLELKWDIYAQIEACAKDEYTIASNTSTLPISDLAKHLVRPERLLITHFFNPAHLVPLVEIVKSEKNSAEVVSATLSLMEKLGKVPVILKKEVPGFIANRLQAALLREALYLIDSGVADAQDIDNIVTSGLGFRWSTLGPIEIADYGGLDTWQSVMANLSPELDCSKSVPTVIKQLNQQGHLGIKTGRGFYQYEEGQGTLAAGKIGARDLAFIRLLKLRQQRGT